MTELSDLSDAARNALGHASRLRDADRLRGDIAADLNKSLEPHIARWPEPVPCGHTGRGWSLADDDPITLDTDGTPLVHLTHECFYAHRYDRHDVYNTTAPLERLLQEHT